RHSGRWFTMSLHAPVHARLCCCVLALVLGCCFIPVALSRGILISHILIAMSNWPCMLVLPVSFCESCSVAPFSRSWSLDFNSSINEHSHHHNASFRQLWFVPGQRHFKAAIKGFTR